MSARKIRSPSIVRESSPVPTSVVAGLSELAIVGSFASSAPSNNSASYKAGYRIASSRCESIRQLQDLVPVAYRLNVNRALNEIATVARKLAEAKEAEAKLKSYVDRNSVPPWLQGVSRAPVYDLTANLPITQAALRQALQDKAKAYVEDVRQTAFEARAEEVRLLTAKVTTEAGKDILERAVEKSMKEICLYQSIPLTYASETGKPVSTGLTGSHLSVWNEYVSVSAAAEPLAQRVVEICMSRQAANTLLWIRKVELKTAADNVMAEDPAPLGRVEVQKLVDAALKVVTQWCEANLRAEGQERSYQKEKGRRRQESQEGHEYEAERPRKRQRRGFREGEYATPFNDSEETRESTNPRTNPQPEKALAWTGSRKRIWERGQEVIDYLLNSDWTYNNPSSYPDILVQIPFSVAYLFVRLKTPREVLELIRSRAGVHVQKGVPDLPASVIRVISSGRRFLFEPKVDESLPEKAWEDFSRRVRWRIKLENSKEEEFDHDYWIPSQKDSEPVDESTEYGLRVGQTSLLRQVAKSTRTRGQPLLADLENARQYLVSNELLTLVSDKNLGYVVVKEEWYRTSLRSFITPETFIKVSEPMIEVYRAEIESHLKQLVNNELQPISTEIGGKGIVKQLKRYLLSTVKAERSEGDTKDWIPELTGIPKLKNWKLRPIVPAATHSWILGPLAKMLSKLLKPYVQTSPTICESSRELGKSLHQLGTGLNTRQMIFATADVESFYTNVPTDSVNWLDRFTKSGSQKYASFLREQVKYVNSRLFIQSRGEVYRQINGLAMGLGCSPDIANLYCTEYERIFANRPEVVFFKRYMDDIFVILVLDDEEDETEVLQQLVYPKLSLTWKTSRTSVVFLDMVLGFNHLNGSIEFSPYSKPLNHYERIPWDSAHPAWLKRGNYLGELSRLAGISSTPNIFVTAVTRLNEILLMRGYPLHALRRWQKDHIQNRWDSRYEVQKPKSKPLVLKSTLNPIWDGINIDIVMQELQDSWSDRTMESLDNPTRMILSRRKPIWASLENNIRLWNKTISEMSSLPEH